MTRRARTLVLAACACALGLHAAPARAAQPDAWITTKVKIALVTSAGVNGVPISVDTYDGHVTLYGKVGSGAERDAADHVASRVQGVRDVRDLIEVVPSERRRQVDATDTRLRTAVAEVLRADPALGDSRIDVRSVDRGTVLLAGRAATLGDQLRALQDAADVVGVRQVQSEIVAPDRLVDRETEPDASAAQASGERVEDAWLTTKAKLEFLADAQVPSGDISVDTHRRVVTLFGTAPTAGARLRAEHVVRAIRGVRDVRNEIQVVHRSEHAAVTAADEPLTAAVRQRLAAADMEGAHIHVDVKAGMARLSGTVESAVDRYSAMVIARSTEGVRAVHDDLRIEAPRLSRR